MAVTQDVFDLVLARGVLMELGEHGGLAHVWWRAPLQDERLVQVYVDGELAEVTDWPDEREVWLTLDRSRPHRIELLAVDAPDALEPHPEALRSWDRAFNTLEAAVLRDERLAVESVVSAAVDGAVADEGPMWSARDHRGGFGALFGVGPFGMDDATGPGLGGGELGYGVLGTDGAAWRWNRTDIDAGAHEVVIEARDEEGSPAALGIAMMHAVEALASGAKEFNVSESFELSWA